MPLDRTLLQELSATRLAEAKVLIKAGHHGGAYYLAGHSVELALKARIAQQFKSESIPDWPFFKDTKTHRLDVLIEIAGLQAELATARSNDPSFDEHWHAVENWRTDCRYDKTSAALSDQLIPALEDQHHGALRWIRTHC
jgi:HEPN domain-containing protein